MSEGTGAPNYGAMDDLALAAKTRFATVGQDQLARFLEAQVEARGSVRITSFELLVDGAGASNGILFFTARIGEGTEADYVLRYDPGTSLIKQKSYRNEFLTVQAAHDVGLEVPRPLWLDADGTYLGASGFVSERIIGQTTPPSVLGGGIFVDAARADRQAMMLAAADFHGRMQRAAIAPQSVPHLIDRGTGTRPTAREIAWWLREVELAAESSAEADIIVQAAQWICDNEPEARPPTLVHGDSQFANHMYRDNKLVAVLDWELAYLGHGEADLALLVFSATTQNNPIMPLDGVPTEQELIACYEAASGRPVQHWEYFRAVSAFKFASGVFLARKSISDFPPVWSYYCDHLSNSLARAGS